MWNCNNQQGQVFRYQAETQAIVLVHCKHKMALDFSAGFNVQLWKRNKTGAQKFRFDKDGTISSVARSGQAIGILFKGISNESHITVQPKNGLWNQQWEVIYV